MPERFVSFEVSAPDAEVAEIAAAFAFDAGASGAEEREAGSGLRVFGPASRADAIQTALSELGHLGIEVGAPAPVTETDWSTAWRAGLEAVWIADALIVRPPFVDSPAPELPDVVIEPGQAFGTGGHASTRLALELMVGLAWPGRMVLDVGTGSGVLALAALRLGAERALGFDLDPLAAPAARQNAEDNGLGGLRLLTGPIDALSEAARFDAVVANMIRTEHEPILGAVVARARSGAVVILSGLLQHEDEGMTAQLESQGLRVVRRLRERDARGDAWLAIEARKDAAA